MSNKLKNYKIIVKFSFVNGTTPSVLKDSNQQHNKGK